jgi:O-methyltransferase
MSEQVVFVKGFFDKTLHTIDDTFCGIRLDGDLYSSTWVALTALYPRLSTNGYCIIDDWILHTARQAVYDYRDANNITCQMFDIDGIGSYWIK